MESRVAPARASFGVDEILGFGALVRPTDSANIRPAIGELIPFCPLSQGLNLGNFYEKHAINARIWLESGAKMLRLHYVFSWILPIGAVFFNTWAQVI